MENASKKKCLISHVCMCNVRKLTIIILFSYKYYLRHDFLFGVTNVSITLSGNILIY